METEKRHGTIASSCIPIVKRRAHCGTGVGHQTTFAAEFVSDRNGAKAQYTGRSTAMVHSTVFGHLRSRLVRRIGVALQGNLKDGTKPQWSSVYVCIT